MRTGPTGAGWGMLLGGAGLLAAGVALGDPTLTGLGVAAAVALASGAGFTLVRPRVVVRRTVNPDRVTVGEPAQLEVEVDNLGRLPAPGFDAVERVDGVPLRLRVPAMGPRASRTLETSLNHAKRGLVRLGPIVVERRDPLGLIRHSRPLSDQAWLWVRPRVHPARALPLGVVLDFEGRLTEQSLPGSTAFASLREYQPGDDPRHIHWRSSTPDRPRPARM